MTVEQTVTQGKEPLPLQKKTPRKKVGRLQKDEIALICIAVIPQLILAAVFYFYVNLSSFALSFQLPNGEWSLFTIKEAWRSIINGGSTIGIGIRNTMLFFVKDQLMLVFQLGVAYFFYKKLKFSFGFQIIFYLPGIISGVAITTMFSNFIRVSGPLGKILTTLGVEKVPSLLADSRYATWTIMFYTIWTGWAGNMLLFNGALARVPIEILESARLDGIGSGREFVQIIFPLIWPTFSTLLILGLTGILGAGGPVLLFTKGSYDTWTIGYWMFDKIKFQGRGAYNEVSATGLIFTLIAAPIILGLRKLIEKIPTVEY